MMRHFGNPITKGLFNPLPIDTVAQTISAPSEVEVLNLCSVGWAKKIRLGTLTSIIS